MAENHAKLQFKTIQFNTMNGIHALGKKHTAWEQSFSKSWWPYWTLEKGYWWPYWTLEKRYKCTSAYNHYYLLLIYNMCLVPVMHCTWIISFVELTHWM